MFHLPNSLRRTRSTAVGMRNWQQEGKETKVQHILGVSEADIYSARNRALHPPASDQVQAVSLSDATTELGSCPTRDDRPPQIPELRLKASSVLLHDEDDPGSERAASMPSKQLKTYDSSSTLHSYYDAVKAPLAISQQTSESSRRDFALRKGTPVVVKSTSPDKDPSRQMKFFKNSKSRENFEPKKLNKPRPQTGHSSSQVSLSYRSVASSDRLPMSASASLSQSLVTVSVSDLSSKFHKGVRLVPTHKASYGAADKMNRTKNALLHPMDPSFVKVNIRRPKAGAMHWFDGLDDDSSEEDDVDEPEFQQTFVNGIESAFLNDRIRAPPTNTPPVTVRHFDPDLDSSRAVTPRGGTQSSPKTPTPQGVPRSAGLSAKASKTSLSPRSNGTKSRSDPLTKANLNHHSVLNLSSSDDEDDDVSFQPVESTLSGPILRDSVIMASMDTDIEIGTAKTIRASRALKDPDALRIKQLMVGERRLGSSMPPISIPPRKESRMFACGNDISLAPVRNDEDLLTSFPATPLDIVPSHRASTRSSIAVSDSGSVESRRLMSVTKQEETLLAAMRMKKALMQRGYSQDKRLDALRNLERGGYKRGQRTRTGGPGIDSSSQISLDTFHFTPQHAVAGHRRSFSDDERGCSRASGTTFQTSTSRNASRLSRSTFRTDISMDPETIISLSSEPSLDPPTTPSLPPLIIADRRESRETDFSTSSVGYQSQTRTITGGSHAVALDDLHKAPKRDGIPSQEFIDWPYNGWEAHAGLGVAH